MCDAQGTPLICHHASGKQIETFQPFTHFGTLKAAKRRAADKAISQPLIHEVYLALTKPLDVRDDEVDNNPTQLLNLAVDRSVISVERRDELLEGVSEAMGQATMGPFAPAEHTSRKWNAGMGVLAPRLAVLGYDGLRYNNTREGDVSFVNFRSDQIWQLGKVHHD